MTDAIKRLREPAALGAALFAALSELAAVIELLFTGNGSFSGIAAGQALNLLSFQVALALAIAVYLANHAGAPIAKARLVTLVSLITAAAGGLFGLVAFFAGLGAPGSGTDKFAYLLAGVAGIIALGLAGWYVWLTWQSAHAAAPAPGPGPVVGGFRPQGGGHGGHGGHHGGHPGQPGPAPQGGQPGGVSWAPGQANDQTAYLPPQNQAGPQTLQAQQSATGSYSVPGGPGGQPGGGDRTQMIPPVPPTMQEYAPSPQPWQPAGPGGQNVPQPPPTRPMPPEGGHTEPNQEPPFGVGNWQ
jgi:hypothetical protein